MLQSNQSPEECPYISPTVVLSYNEERQIACEAAWLVRYSLERLAHPSLITMGPTAHFLCLLLLSWHSQLISAQNHPPPLLLPLRKTPAGPKKQRLWKVQKRQILQSSSFKDTLVQMKYGGLWLTLAIISVPQNQCQKPQHPLLRASLDPKGWVRPGCVIITGGKSVVCFFQALL